MKHIATVLLLAVFVVGQLGCKYTPPVPAKVSTTVAAPCACGCVDCDCCGGCSHCGVKAELLPMPKER
jgi:hypothetical protein